MGGGGSSNGVSPGSTQQKHAPLSEHPTAMELNSNPLDLQTLLGSLPLKHLPRIGSEPFGIFTPHASPRLHVPPARDGGAGGGGGGGGGGGAVSLIQQ